MSLSLSHWYLSILAGGAFLKYFSIVIMCFMVRQILGSDRFSVLNRSSYVKKKTIAMYFVCLQILGTDGSNLFISYLSYN